MNQYLLLAGIVIVACVLLHRFAEKLPVPSLLIFIALGMFFGENGPLGIVFNEYAISENICSACLIVVMFYGGFGTNVHVAKPVAGRAFLLASLGVFFTAAFVGVFSHYLLGLDWMESFLIGAVLSSTDAASVFNILRSQKMALKDHTDSLLELESGSNDPMSYLLTVVMVSLVTGQQVSVPVLFLQQMIFGVLGGLLVGWVSVLLLNRFDFSMEQGKTIFVFAAAIIAYALPNAVGGNGYLSVYLCGILMGNRYFPGKRELVHFFDAVTGISQMMIFFLLGLLVTPMELPQVLIPAILIMIFMTDRAAAGRIGDIAAAALFPAADWDCFLGRAAGCGLYCVRHLCHPSSGQHDLQYFQSGVLCGALLIGITGDAAPVGCRKAGDD